MTGQLALPVLLTPCVPETFRCTHCGEAELLSGGRAAARRAGWRPGTTGGGWKQCYCPACSGHSPAYWNHGRGAAR